MRPMSLQEASARPWDHPWGNPLDEFLDEFYLAHPDRSRQGAMIAAAPALRHDPLWDAFFGATGEHLALRWGLAVPRWSEEPARMGHGLPRTYIPDWPGFEPVFEREAPHAFRRRNLFVGAEPLQRARWPRDEPIREVEWTGLV